MNERVENFQAKLPQLITQVVSKMGRFQYFIVFMLCFNNTITGIANVVTTFYSHQPGFHCGNLAENQCTSNGTCPVGYTFDNEDRTIVSEWSLVCSRSLLVSASGTFYFVGLTIGAFVCGMFADIFGRKPTLLFCLYAQGIIGMSLSVVKNIDLFIALRALQGFFVQGMQTVIYTLLMEYCAPIKRTMAGLVFELMWAVGLMFLGVMDHVVRDWRTLQLFLGIPTIMTLFWAWLIPESMHWLYANHKINSAFRQCVKTAKYNRNYGSIESDHRYWKENVERDERRSTEKLTDSPTTSLRNIFLDVFRTSCLRKHILITASTWFVVALSYYGILYFMPTLYGDRHLNFLVSVVIEFFVYLATYFVLAKFGRRKPLMLFLLMNGICIIIMGICSSYQVPWELQLTISLLARGTSACLFYGTYVYANELFPTLNRGCAFGICGLMGRIGGLLAPFLLPVAQTLSPMVPMSILGVLSIIVGMAQYFLPETLNIQMPNSIEDAKRIWE